MSASLAFDDAQQAIADTLAQFCAERCPEETLKQAAGVMPRVLWRELAELGVLALATPEGDGGARELVAAMEALGAAVFPGPLPATFLAGQLLDEHERGRIARGEWIVSLGSEPLMPFAPIADCFLAVHDGEVYRAEPRVRPKPVDTLGGELWGRVVLERGAPLLADARAWALHDTALAAYTAAAGRQLVHATAEHAKARRQFGRAIGEFQAVAHPLAEAWIQLDAAGALARLAGFAWDAQAPDVAARAGAARLAASRAGLLAAHTGHQLFGALGITTEGPVFHVSRRLRQLASQVPGPDPAREALLASYGLAPDAGPEEPT